MTRNVEETLRRLAPILPVDREGLAAARARVQLAQDAAETMTESHRSRSWVPGKRRWLLAAAVVAAAAVALVASTSTAPPAFASWTAVPARPSTADAAEAVHSCDDAVRPGGTPSPVLLERRGDLVMVLVADRGRMAVCLWSKGSRSRGSIAGSVEESGPAPAGRDVDISIELGTWSQGDGAWAAVSGRAGPDVAELVISRDDGGPVTATVQDGRFAAWWPGTGKATTMTAYGSDGSPLGVVG